MKTSRRPAGRGRAGGLGHRRGEEAVPSTRLNQHSAGALSLRWAYDGPRAPQQRNPQHHGSRVYCLVASRFTGRLCPGGVVKEASSPVICFAPRGREGLSQGSRLTNAPEADTCSHLRPQTQMARPPPPLLPSFPSSPIRSFSSLTRPGPWPWSQLLSLPSRFTHTDDW